MSEVLSPALRRWVGDTLHHEGWLTLVPLASRSDNRVFRIGRDGARYVLKLIAPSRAHAFAHERAITDYLAARGFPVSRVIAAATLPDTDALATLRTWLPGTPAGIAYARGDRAERAELVVALAVSLARVHRVPLAAVGDLWQFPEDRVTRPREWATNFVQKKIASDLARITAALPETDRAALTDEVTAWGRALADAPVALAPLHGDYYWDNLLVDGGAVTGLLDWEAARLGDPLWDLARAEAAAFADAPDAFAGFLAAYRACVPWDVNAARIRRYRLLMAMGDLRYAVCHAPALVPERLPALLDQWRACVAARS